MDGTYSLHIYFKAFDISQISYVLYKISDLLPVSVDN